MCFLLSDMLNFGKTFQKIIIHLYFISSTDQKVQVSDCHDFASVLIDYTSQGFTSILFLLLFFTMLEYLIENKILVL